MKFLPNRRKFLLSLGLSLLIIFSGLSVLGSGGGGESPPPLLPDQDPTGVWDGMYTDLNALFMPIKAIIYKNHWILFYDQYFYDPIAASNLFYGDMSISSNQFSGNLIHYTWESFSYTEPYHGEVYSKDNIHGSSNISSSRFFRLNYLNLSDNNASLLFIEGNWNFTRGANFNIDVSIDQLGNLSGIDSDGCFYNGSVAVPDPHINVYQLTITKSSCDAKNGNYSGLGYVVGGDFIYAFSNNSYAMYGKLGKL